MVKQKGAEVEPVQEEMFGDLDAVATSFESFEDALAYFNANEGIVNIGDVAGDGYILTRDKEQLVNVPFVVIDWRDVVDDATARMYATIRLITSDGRKYRINDGSTGIYQQLTEIRDRHGLSRGIAVAKGLFKSEYLVSNDEHNYGQVVAKDYSGKKGPAATYYLNQSS